MNYSHPRFVYYVNKIYIYLSMQYIPDIRDPSNNYTARNLKFYRLSSFLLCWTLSNTREEWPIVFTCKCPLFYFWLKIQSTSLQIFIILLWLDSPLYKTMHIWSNMNLINIKRNWLNQCWVNIIQNSLGCNWTPHAPPGQSNETYFLAPPAERQRSFSIADSSIVHRPLSVVVRRRPSSTFQLKAWFLQNCLITFFLFWHVASLGWYQCIVKIWIWLNHPKGHFERSNLAPVLLGGNFLKNCLITFSLFMQEASQGGY